MGFFDNINDFRSYINQRNKMPRFAANLTMLFTEAPFLERFALAKAGGFEAVEFLFPYAYPTADIKQRLDDNGLTLVLHKCRI